MFGHPKGLRTLFFTEFWERFSFYGIRGLLILYMTAGLAQGGMGFSIAQSAKIYGLYLMFVYLTALPGGYIADRYLGQRKAIILGACFIALGNFSIAMHSIPSFFTGLALITIGTGFLKPNITIMVGNLYKKDDPRRDGGFTIFYVGINLGSMFAPLLVGLIAQSTQFAVVMQSMGITVTSGWSWAFGITGIGMLVGLVQFYLAGDKRFGDSGKAPVRAEVKKLSQGKGEKISFTPAEKKRLKVVAILFFFSMLFWSAFEQAGSSLNLFARDFTENIAFGFRFPSSWFQSVNAFFIIALAPVFSWLWVRLSKKKMEPSGPFKFALGLLGVGLGFCLLAFAGYIASTTGARVNPMWLVGTYFVHTLGELCLSPVGLSLMTKLAPPRIASFVMGIWFTSAGLGNGLAGWIAGFYDASNPDGLKYMLGGIGLYTLVGAAILFFLVKPVKRLLHAPVEETGPEHIIQDTGTLTPEAVGAS